MKRPEFLDEPALAAVLDALPGARLVGGCVRDALAGRGVADFDLATPEPPEAVMAALAAAGLKAAPTGLKHGTVTAISHHRGFEVTTLRRDVETDGRHAEVAWTDDWAVDAARRDFTFNAMSMTRGGTVFDYFGGQEDLAAGRVRFVGEPAARIAEDYLRILRFFRFYAWYGREAPDIETMEALRDGVGGLSGLSPERVWHEYKRILLAPDPVASFKLMIKLGVEKNIKLQSPAMDKFQRLVKAGIPADPVLRLAALSPTLVEAHSWRLSTADRNKLASLKVPPPSLDLSKTDLLRALADTPADSLIDRSWLVHEAEGERLRGRLKEATPPRFGLTGQDAVALGVPPGPAVGALIRETRAWWMAGGCVASPAECRAELARRVASEFGQG